MTVRRRRRKPRPGINRRLAAQARAVLPPGHAGDLGAVAAACVALAITRPPPRTGTVTSE
jgi:hypothetical protein